MPSAHKQTRWRAANLCTSTKVCRFGTDRSEVRYEVVYRVLLGTSLRFERMRVGQTAHSEERIER